LAYFAVAGGVQGFILPGSFFSGGNPGTFILSTALTAPSGLISVLLADQAVCDPNAEDKGLLIYSRRISLVIFFIGIIVVLYVKHLMSGGDFHM